ncbi:hypothetical protein [Aggregatilinea lenta]|uniref:hypothetical protein n=1 Tax=Aggregatilinea lenta TaxID=913108 RepID=UPI0013C35169|nr:hypothetical protein [Aggregatilinea lenta]
MSCLARLLGLASLALLLLASFSPALAQSGDSTPPPDDVPSTPLVFGEPVSGTLASGAGITYSVDVPAGQDVVLAVDAERVVLPGTCTRVVTASSDNTDCSSEGGGGGDGPVRFVLLYPGLDDPDSQLAVELTLRRPASLEGAAPYTVQAFAVTPQAMAWEDTSVTPDADQPYQVLAFDAATDEPFTVEAEDGAADGGFLWVAYQQPYRNSGWMPSDTPLVTPDVLDNAWSSDDDAPLARMILYYVGGGTFHLLVHATEPYALHPAVMPVYDLAAGEPLDVIVSYREPLALVRLEPGDGEAVVIDVEVTEGTGAHVQAYTEATPYGYGPALGVGADGSALPLAGTLNTTLEPDGTLVTIQVPFEFTRDSVTVTLIGPE